MYDHCESTSNDEKNGANQHRMRRRWLHSVLTILEVGLFHSFSFRECMKLPTLPLSRAPFDLFDSLLLLWLFAGKKT